MRRWSAEQVARAAGARLQRAPRGADLSGPSAAAIDTRALGARELFVGLRGMRTDGGEHAPQALRAGAWGVLVSEQHAARALRARGDGAVLVHPDPLHALQVLARTWREELGASGAKVVAITGSTGKTSTKDILAALLAPQRQVLASPQNLNTEIGMPLAMLAAPAGTQVLVLEMAMRGPGQIAELAGIAAPDVGVIVNVGPVHLELLGSLEAIAAAKAELIGALAPGAALVVPVAEPLLRPHLRADLHTITFGPGGDVELAGLQGAPAPGAPGGQAAGRAKRTEVTVSLRARPRQPIVLRPSFSQAHNVLNLLAAVGAAHALGVTPQGDLDVTFSALRGERIRLARDVVLIADCYNANPMSMRAAIDDLARTAAGRRVAVLGDMLELGERADALHREVAEHAARRGVELLVTVGPLAQQMRCAFDGQSHGAADALGAARLLPALLQDGDTVLVKGSRAVHLEHVVQALSAREGSLQTPSHPRAPQLAGRRES